MTTTPHGWVSSTRARPPRNPSALRRARRATPYVVMLAALWCVATAQPDAPHTEPPAQIAAALAEIRDFSLNFDHPGFETVLLHVARHPPPVDPPPLLENWIDLVERPHARRGHWVTIEGDIGRNSSWRYTEGPPAQLGELTQIELFSTRQPLAATVIFTQPADDLPRGARVRVTGRFVMVRKYLAPTADERYALLLVAQGPTAVATPTGSRVGGDPGSYFWLGAIVLILVVGWRVMRRRVADQVRMALPRDDASRPAAPFSVAEDAARWAAEDQPMRENSPESAARKQTSPDSPSDIGDRT